MTKEQKIKWLENASNQEVIDQMIWAVYHINSEVLSYKIEGQADLKLVEAEMLKRMSK